MTFRRFINIATWVFVSVVLVAILLHSCGRQKLKAEIMALTDEQYLTMQLSARYADDCKVTPLSNGGWRCVEYKKDCGNGEGGWCGRIFIVRRPM